MSTTNSNGFTDQLGPTTFNGAPVTLRRPSRSPASRSRRRRAQRHGDLAAGSYTVSGTDANGIGDTGTWSYTLTVTGVNIPQGPSTSGSVSTTNSNGFTDQLGPTTFNGAPVTFTTNRLGRRHHGRARRRAQRHGDLGRGSYTVSGTDANGIGDTGTWSYTLTVTGVNIPQGPRPRAA